MTEIIKRLLAASAYEQLDNPKERRLKDCIYDAISEINACYESGANDEKELTRLRAELDKCRWIPVSERLPETDGYYLVRISLPSRKPAMVIYYLDGRFFVLDYVTRWMPIPEPLEDK